MFRQKSKETNGNSWRAARQSCERDENDVFLSEWRLAFFGLVFSLCVLFGKLLYAYHDNLYDLLHERRLITYRTIITDGEIIFKNSWTSALRYSWLWFPALCGVLTTWFTWLMVYLDSSVPGVQPPTPLSPVRYKLRSGHAFHLNYIFAVMVGVLVFVYMYAKGAAL